MLFKRIALVLLAILMCIGSFVSCGSKSEEISDDTSEKTAENGKDESSVNESSENDMPTIDNNPGAPEEITSHKMIFKCVHQGKYTVTTETDAGTLFLTFDLKNWGTFNLGAWALTDKDGKYHSFLAGATDLEYVYRVGSTPSAWVWSGGNHGNEVLVSLEMYNGETEEKLELDRGTEIPVNVLKVVEKTKLLYTPDTDGDGYGYNNKSDPYSESDVYCEVTRTYTFTGPQIKLDVDYNYVKDSYQWLSYTCMFPISKKYGLWCDMIDKDGNLIKTIETEKVGLADYSGPQYSGNAATRAVIYGYKDTRFKFDVRVNTFADSLDNQINSYKTSFWDMNTTDNKLYFSKYDLNSPTLVKSGTKLHTQCIWLFRFDEE